MRDLPATVPAWGTLRLDMFVRGRTVGQMEQEYSIFSDADGLVIHKFVASANVVESKSARTREQSEQAKRGS